MTDLLCNSAFICRAWCKRENTTLVSCILCEFIAEILWAFETTVNHWLFQYLPEWRA